MKNFRFPLNLLILNTHIFASLLKFLIQYLTKIQKNKRIENRSLSLKKKHKTIKAKRISSSTQLKAWRPRKMDFNEHLIVDFGTRVIINSVATQGRRAAREFVTLYTLQYSDNGKNWFYYTDENKIVKHFQGNYDDNSAVKVIYTCLL